MTEVVLALAYIFNIVFFAFAWFIPMREQIDQLKTRIILLEKEMTELHTRLNKQNEEIKKIKGQFIWNDEVKE